MSKKYKRNYHNRGYGAYERVDSDPTLVEIDGFSDDEGSPVQNLLTPGSTRVAYDPNEIEPDSYEAGPPPDSEYDLERYEMDDRIGEMPPSFNRRHRREGLFQNLHMGRNRTDSSLETSELLKVNHTHAHHERDSLGIDETHTKGSDEEPEEKGVKKYAKLILPHVGLVLLTCTYTVIGALIFYSVENPNEISSKRHQLNLIYLRQEQFVTSMMELASSNETDRAVWAEIARMHMHNMSDHLFIAFEKFFLTSNEVKKNEIVEIWSFSTAIFFAVTVVTTIGYGNPVPITQLGRMMCIIFSLFGIPLTLVTIADLGKFLSEHLIWLYGKYLRLKHYLCRRVEHRKHREHVCGECKSRGLAPNMEFIEEQRIPALLVLTILLFYTALGGVLMSHLEPWSFFTSFYWSFITMTTVGFGDLMPRRDQYMYLILLYIVLGLAITTMCIDLVGVQYIRKIHYFGRKINDAKSALAVVSGKVVKVSELYTTLMQKRAKENVRGAFFIENLYVSKHIIPYIPTDIRFIRYIDQNDIGSGSRSTSTSSLELHSCRFCHSRFSISHQT
uniref:Potassium channel domain-containing protein n=1 Tax=Acrobeloides nanus TaxID=290746 RepID=A0A914E0N9_9BILA